MNYSKKLNSLIPGGAHTYSRGDDQYPSNAPSILEKGKGAYVWDEKGNKFLDYGMGLRSVTLGYANQEVNQAAIKEIEKGVNLTRASTVEMLAAETMIDLIPGAEMVKFAKNGSNVTTAAVKLARAYTGRKFVCVPKQQPFFSFDDWFIGTTPVKRGIPIEHYSTTLVFEYNNINSLVSLFTQFPDQIAAVIMEPATTLLPAPTSTQDYKISGCTNSEVNFLQELQQLCKQNGALFILDEMISGFRWHLNGAQTYFELDPDLSTFGKGMANGFAVSALVGKKDIMSLGSIHSLNEERTFLASTTHGAEMSGMGAFIEAVHFYKNQNVISHLWDYGEKLYTGINDISKKLGLLDYFHMDGNYVSMNYVAKDANGAISLQLRTLFAQEMIKEGVLIPWVSPSFSHGNEELSKTLSAVESALEVYKLAIEEGVEKYLCGPAIKPVFRQYN